MRRTKEVIKALLLMGTLGALASTAQAASYPTAGIAEEIATSSEDYTVAGIVAEIESIPLEIPEDVIPVDVSEETPTEVPEEQPVVNLDELIWEYFSDEDALTLARLVKSEAGGLPDDEKTLVIWTVFNRKDDPAFPDTVQGVILEKNQFAKLFGYTPEGYALVLDVMREYVAEQVGLPAARTLPKGYLWFKGDGKHNHFFNDYAKWCQFPAE